MINLLIRKKEIEIIANQRLAKCYSCEYIDKTGDYCAVPGTKPCCSICGCSLHVMTRSLSAECSNDEDKQWGAVMTQEQEDKLYEKIKYKAE